MKDAEYFATPKLKPNVKGMGEVVQDSGVLERNKRIGDAVDDDKYIEKMNIFDLTINVPDTKKRQTEMGKASKNDDIIQSSAKILG